MNIPEGMTEEQVLATFEKVVRKIADKYSFGFYDIDDIRQEAYIICLQGLENYDGRAPLEHFLSVHLGKKLKSFKRDNYYRPRYECNSCRGKDPECLYCQKREKYNVLKRNLMSPIDIDGVAEDNEKGLQINDTTLSTVEIKEMYEIIDLNISLNLREYYLRIKDGVYVSKDKRDLVIEEIRKILDVKET